MVDVEGLNLTPLLPTDDDASGLVQQTHAFPQIDMAGAGDADFTGLLPNDGEVSGLVPQAHGDSPLDVSENFRDLSGPLEQWRQHHPSFNDFSFPSPGNSDIQDREQKVMSDLHDLAAGGGPSEDTLPEDAPSRHTTNMQH